MTKELANRAIKAMCQGSMNEISVFLDGRQLRNQSVSTISLTLACEIIYAMTGVAPAIKFKKGCSVEYEWALEARCGSRHVRPALPACVVTSRI